MFRSSLCAVAGLMLFAGGAALEAEAQATAATAAPAYAKKPTTRAQVTEGAFTLDIVDYSPQFLDWYEAAQAAPDADARFALWKERYGQASVPPTPEGQAMARRLVDAAWPRYGEAAAIARKGAAGLAVEPAKILAKAAGVLGITQARMRLITIIGGFEENAYTYGADMPVLVISLETKPEHLERQVAHEGTHALHLLAAGLTSGWERSIAQTTVMEGLAMHTSRVVAPGLPLEAYLTQDPAWWTQAQAKKREILTGIRRELSQSSSDAVTKYTMGAGNTGLTREAYAAGWWIVEQMQKDGATLADIARIRQEDLPAKVDAAIGKLLVS